MTELAIIGGTGLRSLSSLEIIRKEVVHTPYGEPSSAITHGTLFGHSVAFLARHGYGHTIPPHRVNYRANLWALHSIGVKKIISVAAVGGIRDDMTSSKIVIPDQIIDYTYSREHTFFGKPPQPVVHIDFTYPYCEDMRQILIRSCELQSLEFVSEGTYGATQGPRLETAQEINRMERDGCDLVGMTGMPEAALAKELELCYAACTVVANRAAGRSDGEITMEKIDANLTVGMEQVRKLLEKAIPECFG